MDLTMPVTPYPSVQPQPQPVSLRRLPLTNSGWNPMESDYQAAQTIPATAPVADESSISRGLRSSLANYGSDIQALGSGIARVAGADEYAERWKNDAQAVANQAHIDGPEIDSYTKVKDIPTGLRYVGGLLGGALPAAAVGLGTAALTRNPMLGLAAATAAFTPVETGGAIKRQWEDPVAMKNNTPAELMRSAALEGGTRAFVGNVVPSVAGAKIIGKLGAGSTRGVSDVMARNIAEGALTNSAAGVASEGVTTYASTQLNPNRDTSRDEERYKEAAIAGGIMGTGFGAAGGAGEIAHGGAKPLPTPKPKPDLETAKKIARDEPLHPVNDEAGVAASDKTATQKATDYVADILNDVTISPEIKAKVSEAAQNLGDAAKRAYVASIKVGQDYAAKVSELAGRFKDRYDEQRDAAGTTKASQDLSGPRAVISDVIYPLIEKNAPELMNHPDSIVQLGDVMSKTILAMQLNAKLPKKTFADLHELLGDDMPGALHSLYTALHGKEPTAEQAAFYGGLTRLAEKISRNQAMRDLVSKNLVDPSSANTTHVRQVVDRLREYVASRETPVPDINTVEGKAKAAKRKYEDLLIDKELSKTFGENKDAVLEAFRKEREGGKDESAIQAEKKPVNTDDADLEAAKMEAAGHAADEHALETDHGDLKDQYEKPTVYAGRDGPFVLSHEAHVRDYGNDKSQADRLLAQARQENPDRNVSFVSAKEYAAANDISPEQLHAMTRGKPDDYGVVVAEGMKQEGRITPEQADAFKWNNDYKHDIGKLTTDKRGVTLDATKITSEGFKTLDNSVQNEDGMERLARAFHQGLVGAMDHFGAKVTNLKDNTVVAFRKGSRIGIDADGSVIVGGGKSTPITYGDIKNLIVQRKEPEWIKRAKEDGVSDKKINETIERRELMSERDDSELRRLNEDTGKKIVAVREKIAAEVREEVEAELTGKVKGGKKDWDKAFDEAFKKLYKKRLGENERLARLDEFSAEIYKEIQKRDSRESLRKYKEGNTTGGLDKLAELKDAESNLFHLIKKVEKRFGSVEDAPEIVRAKIERLRDRIRKFHNEFYDDYGNRTSLRKSDAGTGLKEIPPDGEIHLLAADNNGHVPAVQFDLAGNKITYARPDPSKAVIKDNKLTIAGKMRLEELFTSMANSERPIEQNIGKRALDLMDKIYAMDAVDQVRLSGLLAPESTALKPRPLGEKFADKMPPKSMASRVAKAVEVLGEKYKDTVDYTRRFDAVTEKINAGGDELKAVLDRLGKAENAKNVQQAVDHLLKQPRNENIDAALEAANARISELIKKDKTAAYDLMLKNKRSEDKLDQSKEAGDGRRKIVEKYIENVLGPNVAVEWAKYDKMQHAGEFEPGKPGKPGDLGVAKDIVRISVHALDPLSVAYHESLHGFFSSLRKNGNEAIAAVVERAAGTTHVLKQLREYFKDNAEVLKQIENSPEERAAYMFQIWEKDRAKMVISKPAETFFERVKATVLKALGMWSNEKRAEHILEYFRTGEYAKNMGEPNMVARVLMEPGSNKVVNALKQFTDKFDGRFAKLGDALVVSGSSRLRDMDNPAMSKIADLIMPKAYGTLGDQGFIPTARIERTQRMNKLAEAFRGLSEEDLIGAHEALKKGTQGSTPGQRQAVTAVRGVLADMHAYMTKSGVKINLKDPATYFPRVWDAEYISRNQQAFKDMMQKYVTSGQFDGSVEGLMNSLMAREGAEQGVVVMRPGFNSMKFRKLDFIEAKDAAPFVNKNLFEVVNNYVTQGTRRAEWAKRFGDDGSGLGKLLDEAKNNGATQEQIDVAQDFIRGVDGTLGDDINATARRLSGNMIVYQNMRLLPLAIFSSIIDPGGIVVRGGTVHDAFAAFKRGIAEIPRGFKKQHNDDAWYQLAQDMGTIDDTTLVHTLGAAYTQGMVSSTARKINDTFFKYNLMEQFNTSMRVSATQAAAKFLVRHADGTHSKRSVRWLEELGLKPNEVIVKDGMPLLTREQFMAHGLDETKATEASNKMRGAMNRWVDGAILRPNAADKPIWMNDPHYMLIAHLKQFTYSFHHTILNRTINEFKEGNAAPAFALASYVPMMLAADTVKGMIQGGGEQPDWKKGWDAGDYLWSATQRAGLLGVGQFGADVVKNINQGGLGVGALTGPTLEQLWEGAMTAGGREQFKTLAVHSMPANALYAHALKTPSTDPQFVE